MAYSGFGRNSGPSAQPGAQNPLVNFPRLAFPSSPLSASPRSSIDYRDLDASEGIFPPPLDSSWPFPGAHKSDEPSLRRDDVKASSHKDHGVQYQRPSTLLPHVATRNLRTGTPATKDEIQSVKRTNSSYSRSPDEISNISRSVMDSPSHLPPSNKSYLVTFGSRSPPLVYQNNPYVTSQHPHSEVQQRPFSSVWVNPSKLSSQNTTPAAQGGISPVSTTRGTHQSGPMFQTKHADGPLPKRSRSPAFPSTTGVSPENTHSDGHKRSLVHYRDLDAPEDMSSPPLTFESSSSRRESSQPFAGVQNVLADQSKPSINNTTPLDEEGMPSPLTTRGAYQSERKFQIEHADVQFPKRTRSPTNLSTIGDFPQNPATISDSHKRAPGFQSRSLSPSSRQGNIVEAASNKPMDFPAVKRTKIPLQSLSDPVSQENLDPAQEIERELHAKAKRLARFKDELSQPVQSHPTVKNQKDPAKRQHMSMPEKQKSSEDPKMDMMVDSAGANVHPDYEAVASSSIIIGLCPDMCPESERAERERKGDLDQYERLDGDRNLSSEFLAVKKYTRTAEREPELIRPMPILQKTMDYLLNLLDEPYDDRFLSLYNFLWDRMRAIRMDLRMQHIFNLEAISMLEQMIRLHIIAMHELCEYTKGEGFSEGFDAHLNIEQMNKTSVELFQLYDDHRKRGIHVPSEREFRGYYALLKLDKHPGYKVEPAELSLDLAKMTPEMRQTPEVIFARDVARACRTGNFIAFFRLARKASYLQACLMHAHFSKLRTQALASLHCGLQNNQGIPITLVAKWLGMEEEDIGELLEYYGFSVKDFEEPYMVKENAFVNVDNDFPVKRSNLVERKRSRMITNDVSYPSLNKSYADGEVKESQLKKDALPRAAPLQSIVPISTPQLSDEEMNDLGTSLSPKSSMQSPMHIASIFPTTPDKTSIGVEVQVAPPTSPLVSDFISSSLQHHQSGIESAQKPKFEPAFRISFGRSKKPESGTTEPARQETAVTQTTAEEKRDTVTPLDSVVHTPSPHPMFPDDLEDEEVTRIVEEDIPDEETSSYDKEVEEAKLRLILRIWKRRATKKRILREHRQFSANAALDFLPLGTPMWQFEAEPGNSGTFNIDHVMTQRHEVQERSWSVLNPSNIIAPTLVQKNPDAKCLCWKLVLCSEEERLHEDNLSPACSWLYSKLMPADDDGADDMLVTSHSLAIWRSWVPSQSGLDPICCLSVIKSTTFEDANKALTGANALLFLLSDRIALHLQKKRLHDLVMSLPSGSCLPLLILSSSCKDESDPSTIAEVLELKDIDKSRVVDSCITYLKDLGTKRLDGFFSDENLTDGLEWLACESPPQIVVTGIKTRERVLTHLNTTLEFLDDLGAHRVGPNDCIASFNEALDRSMKEIGATADANPMDWPCPEIYLLEELSDEYQAVMWHLPRVGWSLASRIEVLMSALNDSKLPLMQNDLSWLSRGLNIGDDIGEHKSCLENCLIGYLTETSRMMGVAMAQNEAGIVLQNATSLELRDATYYITPKWVSIFRRIFNWRLMRLNSREVSSTYILAQNYSSAPSSGVTFLLPYVAQPSFDELVEVGCFATGLGLNQPEREDIQLYSPMASDDPDIQTSNGNVVPMENQEEERTRYNHEEEINGAELPVQPTKTRKEADKLSQLLEKCNIVQNLIDEKLSIFF